MRKVMGLFNVRLGVLALCAVAAVAFALNPTQARADEITLAGSTTGYFDGTPGLTALNGGGLSFISNTLFNTNTVGGTAALVLGDFFLSQSPFNYNGNSFTLDINFTSPPGSGNVDTTAEVQGSVSLNGGGVWVVNFAGPQDVYFNGGANYFQLAVNSLSLTPGSGVELTGFVDYTGSTGGAGGTVPEPSTMTLAGLGIACVFLLKKRLLLA